VNQASNVLYGRLVTMVSVVLASVWNAAHPTASSRAYDQ
jgi:type IV secretion system protein VirD4